MNSFRHAARWRRRLHQLGHGAKLLASLAVSSGRLVFLKIRALLARRELVAIGLTEHIGDIVACEPVARHVREIHPSADIFWVVSRNLRALVDSHPALTGILPVLCFTEWRLLASLKLFDRTFDLHVGGKVCYDCGIQFSKPGPTLEDYFSHGPLLTSFSIGAGLPPIDDAPRFFFPPHFNSRAETFGLSGSYIVLHTVSNDGSKCWPPDSWGAVAASLKQEGLRVIEVGFRHDVLEAEDICGRLSLLELAAVIRDAALFAGIDSGPAHIANALGTRGVVLLGSYRHFREYMPFTGGYAAGTTGELLRSAGAIAEIGVSDVCAAIRRQLAKRHSPAP